MDEDHEILTANARYADAYPGGDLPAPPARRLVVLTCMDARIDPIRLLGLELGDAHVIRNAGGLVTEDALRSLAMSHHLLGTQRAVLIGHTDCGSLTFTNESLRARIGEAARSLDFLPFADLDASVAEGVRRIRETPLLPEAYEVHGFVLDVRDGRLREVA